MVKMPLEHPKMQFHCPMSEELITLGFGYLRTEAMMPVFKGDELILMIPREVMIAALESGWENDEAGWWMNPNKN